MRPCLRAPPAAGGIVYGTAHAGLGAFLSRALSRDRVVLRFVERARAGDIERPYMPLPR